MNDEVQKHLEQAGIQKPHVQGGKYAQLNKLTAEQFDRVVLMLKEGTPPNRVAKMIQDDWGQCLTVTEQSLGQALNRYRHEHITDFEIAQNVDPSTVKRLRKRIDADLNLFDEYEALIRLNLRRIRWLRGREAKFKWPEKDFHDSVGALGKLMKDYGELRLKVGVLKNYLGDTEESRKLLDTRAFDKVLGNEGVTRAVSESLRGAMERVLEAPLPEAKDDEAEASE